MKKRSGMKQQRGRQKKRHLMRLFIRATVLILPVLLFILLVIFIRNMEKVKNALPLL